MVHSARVHTQQGLAAGQLAVLEAVFGALDFVVKLGLLPCHSLEELRQCLEPNVKFHFRLHWYLVWVLSPEPSAAV